MSRKGRKFSTEASRVKRFGCSPCCMIMNFLNYCPHQLQIVSESIVQLCQMRGTMCEVAGIYNDLIVICVSHECSQGKKRVETPIFSNGVGWRWMVLDGVRQY